MQKCSLAEIVEYARNNSFYYKNLYQDINFQKLSDLPIVDLKKFWKEDILTEKNPHGIVFKSGGSTGAPKYSYFTDSEWESYTEAFGFGMAQGILADGDRVANLFYVGDLYASFLFIKDSLQKIIKSGKKIAHFPISGQTDEKQILKILNEFKINTLLGVPSALILLLENYFKNKALYPFIKVEKILFGGEALYHDQEKRILEMFPEIKISSIGCASVDGGLIGYSDLSCKNNEHRAQDGISIIEIVDIETDEIITEKNKKGKILLTNLTRKLMPIIRYPAGDMAYWVDDEKSVNRKFKLIGRSEEVARLGTLNVDFEDTREMLATLVTNSSGFFFQLILTHFEKKDEMTIRLSNINISQNNNLTKLITEQFVKEKIAYNHLLEKKLIHPLRIEIVENEKMERNPRTGKLKHIIDLRAQVN